MELLYCHNCNFQVDAGDLTSGTAVRMADNKILCGKCAPLFQHTTSFFVTVPLPNEIGNTTHVISEQLRQAEQGEEQARRAFRVRVLVGAAAIVVMVAVVLALLLLM